MRYFILVPSLAPVSSAGKDVILCTSLTVSIFKDISASLQFIYLFWETMVKIHVFLQVAMTACNAVPSLYLRENVC